MSVLYHYDVCAFIATFCSVSVVAEYNKYWVKLPGPVVNQRDVPPMTTQSHTTPPVHTTTPSILPGPVSVCVICSSEQTITLCFSLSRPRYYCCRYKSYNELTAKSVVLIVRSYQRPKLRLLSSAYLSKGLLQDPLERFSVTI